MKKKLCMLMALLMVCLSAAACAETIELKVWSAQPDQALLEELCNAFAAEHPENQPSGMAGNRRDRKTRNIFIIELCNDLNIVRQAA